MKKLLFIACLIFWKAAISQTLNIIPEPVKGVANEGTFTITPATKIVLAGQGAQKSADFLNTYLKEYYGFKLSLSKSAGAEKNVIILHNANDAGAVKGAYSMTVDKDKANINGDNEEGVFYGIQTLIQLLPVEKSMALAVQQCSIEDAPRFGYRGLHLDCGRHFFSVDFIKRYIDFIALHKMNTFHWHLTEDQGWRIEIKRYPKLTEVGSCREQTIIGHNGDKKGYDNTKYCGYYTQAQVKEIVKYAADRYITIIPEIEMPGHALAALTSYPYLGCTKGPYQVAQKWGVFKDVFCAGNDSTYTFIENVLDEVMALFPSKYIHIGGDECPKDAWKTCPVCQKKIKDEGLKDENALQSYFIQRIEKYLNSKGRAIIGWDEILEGGLAPNATVMSWRGEEGGIEAAKQHHNVIMTPGRYVYFDHAQSKSEDSLTIGGDLPLQVVYNYEPVPAELNPADGHYILGAQANVWSEYMANNRKVEYMIFPRLSALSEVLWSSKDNKNWDSFLTRMQTQYKRYDLWKVDYNTKGITKDE
ncbi:MAG TPA: beta-N-acetylhexosaminidase [Chitinophagaceae bacterium]|nr:beta-N-acetylhexosaminidase [Chitinophagaceae bacterium]